jgi:hypothetical protein
VGVNDKESVQQGWLDDIAKHNLPKPHIYGPDSDVMPDMIVMEWDTGPNCITLDITLSSQSGYFHNLNFDTDECVEATLDLTHREGWMALKALFAQITNC